MERGNMTPLPPAPLRYEDINIFADHTQGRASKQTGSAESTLPVCMCSQNGELWH